MPATLKVVKTLWGVEDADDTSRWDALFERIKREGFDAVEAIPPTWRKDKELFRSLLDKYGLALVCQIHTTGGGETADGEYEYCVSNKLHDHLASFVALTSEAAQLKPVLINSHSGHDSWGSGDKAVSFLKQALKIEAALGIPVVHETHRQRLFYDPYRTAELLANEKLQKLKINADLSHWCCVCEHVFDLRDKRDDFWPATLEAVARHCGYVHCRVGHAEGPQVSDPDAPEWSSEVDTHFEWWRAIWRAMCNRGETTIWSEPEFGPPPYLWTLPHTRMPVADLWAINHSIAARMRAEFDAAMASLDAPLVPAAGDAPVTEGFYAVQEEGPHRPLDYNAWRHKGAPEAAKAPMASYEGQGKPLLGESANVGEALGKIAAMAGGGGGADGGAGGGGDGAAPPPMSEEEAKRAAKAEKEALKEAEKLRKAVIKEGGKKGVEIEGASDMGGLDFFCTTIENAAGMPSLLQLAMTAMNAPPDEAAEERRGCSGHVGKMVFSASAAQLAIVAYVPADKLERVPLAEWLEHVCAATDAVVTKEPCAADSPHGGLIAEAVALSDADNGKFAIKDKDTAMAAAFGFLREKGAFPEDAGDSDDEPVFGDDAFDEMNGW